MISHEDRELARELTELFDLNEQAMKMLGVVLSSHRQLPADDKPAPAPSRCLALSPALEQWGGIRLQCEKGPEHGRDQFGVSDSRHEALPPGESFPVLWMDDVQSLS